MAWKSGLGIAPDFFECASDEVSGRWAQHQL